MDDESSIFTKFEEFYVYNFGYLFMTHEEVKKCRYEEFEKRLLKSVKLD